MKIQNPSVEHCLTGMSRQRQKRRAYSNSDAHLHCQDTTHTSCQLQEWTRGLRNRLSEHSIKSYSCDLPPMNLPTLSWIRQLPLQMKRAIWLFFVGFKVFLGHQSIKIGLAALYMHLYGTAKRVEMELNVYFENNPDNSWQTSAPAHSKQWPLYSTPSTPPTVTDLM